jgi:predicted NUDIX family NTP pyrophosphohydrolase
MYRRRRGSGHGQGSDIQVFLVHPGGPFFKNKDEGVWSIPKGIIEDGEDPLNAARREFEEEVGFYPEGPVTSLGAVKQKSGKTVLAWAYEARSDEQAFRRSNTFEMEWPPHSGKRQSFPEVDRGEYFDPETAKRKIYPYQADLIDRLAEELAGA